MKYLFAVPLALALACGGGASDAKPTAVDLPKLGLKMDAPAGSTVSDGIMGGVMVQGPNLIVTIDEATDTRPKTAEDATKDVDMYNPQNAKSEKLADGFALTFENTGDLGKNYWVHVRRELGGKAYWCETTSSSPEQQTAALAACKSLKK
jgi:hypothetical protein